MVLVAGLDRLEGTKVGPWLTDAEWQDHTRELRERFEARSDTITLDGRELRVRVDKGQKSARPRNCLLYTSPSPRDKRQSRMPSSA